MTPVGKRPPQSPALDPGTVQRQLARWVSRRRRRVEWVPVLSALDRISTRTLRARRVVPSHDLSMMDGFAVRSLPSERRSGASTAPRRLVGRSFPEDDRRRLPRIEVDTAVEVLTGAPLPSGADAVVRWEMCRRKGRVILPKGPFVPGRDIARAGEDFRPGDAIIRAGVPLRPWHIAALLANEVSRVRLLLPPRVGVLSTGDELARPGRPLRSAEVRDTTKPLLLGMLAELGVGFLDLGWAPDREASIRRAVVRGLTRCDVVVTIGGSSGGERDLVFRSIQRLSGSRVLARKIRLRPGSSTGVVIVRGRPVFVLPGPPVAAWAGFRGIVEPYLRSREDTALPVRWTREGRLDRSIDHSPRVREFRRVRLDSVRPYPRASVIPLRGGSRLSSLTDANGFVILEKGRGTYRKGETVQVHQL